MQGIRFFEYKTLLKSLSELRETGFFHLPPDEIEAALEKETMLKELYVNYQLSLQIVSENIRQFEQQKNLVRMFVKKNRQHLKDSMKITKTPVSTG